MELNTTLTRCLLPGSLVVIGAIAFSCGYGEYDTRVQADWVFVNKTTRVIEVQHKNFDSFVLQPDSTYIYHDGGLRGSKEVTAEDYDSPYYDNSTKVIVDNNAPRSLVKGEGITDVKNYTAEKVEKNYFKFTYIFTEEAIAW